MEEHLTYKLMNSMQSGTLVSFVLTSFPFWHCPFCEEDNVNTFALINLEICRSEAANIYLHMYNSRKYLVLLLQLVLFAYIQISDRSIREDEQIHTLTPEEIKKHKEHYRSSRQYSLNLATGLRKKWLREISMVSSTILWCGLRRYNSYKHKLVHFGWINMVID